jgi:hypothetical protein
MISFRAYRIHFTNIDEEFDAVFEEQGDIEVGLGLDFIQGGGKVQSNLVRRTSKKRSWRRPKRSQLLVYNGFRDDSGSSQCSLRN